MQNRLVVAGIPSSVPHLPNAAEALRDLIEDHGCWVDRFAFLTTENNDSGTIVAAAELHVENVRDDAIQSLDGLTVVLDESGCLISSTKDNDDNANNLFRESTVEFTICASPATHLQSKQLIEQCPIHDDDEHIISKQKQTLVLPIEDMKLTIRSSIERGGGTGSTPWRGGLLLSHQVCHWYQERENNGSINNGCLFDSLFCNRTILELGAGCSGLPSMTLAKIDTKFHCDMTIICSDGVDEIVDALSKNVRENRLHDCVSVKHINWSDYCDSKVGQEPPIMKNKADTILFADCIYNDKCAIALCQAILQLVKSGGSIIGVLPDNRVGVDLFEKRMKQNGFNSELLPIIANNSNEPVNSGFNCTGGGGKQYRMLLFSKARN